MTSMTNQSGAILLAFPSTNLNLFTYAFWQKSSLDTPSYAINGNLIRRKFQHKDLGETFPLTFSGQNTIKS